MGLKASETISIEIITEKWNTDDTKRAIYRVLLDGSTEIFLSVWLLNKSCHSILSIICYRAQKWVRATYPNSLKNKHTVFENSCLNMS